MKFYNREKELNYLKTHRGNPYWDTHVHLTNYQSFKTNMALIEAQRASKFINKYISFDNWL